MCATFMIDYNIKNVYYSDVNGNIVKEKTQNYVLGSQLTETSKRVYNNMPINNKSLFNKYIYLHYT